MLLFVFYMWVPLQISEGLMSVVADLIMLSNCVNNTDSKALQTRVFVRCVWVSCSPHLLFLLNGLAAIFYMRPISQAAYRNPSWLILYHEGLLVSSTTFDLIPVCNNRFFVRCSLVCLDIIWLSWWKLSKNQSCCLFTHVHENRVTHSR